MKIKWLLYLIPAYFTTLFSIILTPIIVLFCNEEGELKFPFNYFQTWDDSCDSSFFMEEVCPTILDYDYHSKYETIEKPIEDNRTKIYSKLKPNATFTIKERIQRYFCRVLWLLRNPAYGFMYHIFGANINGENMQYVKFTENYKYGTDGKYFICKNDKKIFGRLYWKIFIGWKISNIQKQHRAMYAYRLWVDYK